MTENNGWMDLDHVPIFTKDGRQFAMILSSENYKHVNVINRDTNQRVPITTGDMVVTNIYFWDEEDNKIYFRATRVGGPGERHVRTYDDIFYLRERYYEKCFIPFFCIDFSFILSLILSREDQALLIV